MIDPEISLATGHRQVPLPDKMRRRPIRRYPWVELRQIGDSFHVRCSNRPEARQVARSLSGCLPWQRVKHSREYLICTDPDGLGVRVWLLGVSEPQTWREITFGAAPDNAAKGE